MKKLFLLASLAAALHAETPPQVVIVNVNSALASLFRNAAGFNTTQPYAEILILHPSPAVDGYRIHVTYSDAEGVKHEIIRDGAAQTTADDHPMLEVFWIDAATISATVTPYKLQLGSVTAP